MGQQKRVKMTKKNGRDSVAVANVLPDHVPTWEKAGWVKDETPQADKGAK